MTKIWSRRSSSNAQKVYWTLAELEVPHEAINAGGQYGIVHEAEYRRKNPNGLVPTLEEADGFVLFESNAIVRYLADVHGRGRLQPENPQQRARSDSFTDWTSSTLEPPIAGLWVKHVLKRPRPDQPADDVLVANAVKALEILSSALSPDGYLLGASLSVGDIALGVLVNRWYKIPVDNRPELPRIKRYHELLSTRPAYREHVIEAPLPPK